MDNRIRLIVSIASVSITEILNQMIKKIKRIKNFGIFSDFSINNEVKDFQKYNLIYGWNYSGKTTLSRIFRCFEQRCIPPDFAGASFELIDADESSISEQFLEIAHTVRVFNSDFVEDNLKWNNDLEPIFLIGQDNIEKEEELKFEKDNLQTLSESVLGIKNTIQEIDKNINEALTVKAKDIKQTLLIPDYNKTKFESKIIEIANDFDNYVLTESQLSDALSEYFSNDKKSKISQVDKLIFDTNKLQKNIEKLLKTTIVSKTIERLREDEILQNGLAKDLQYIKINTAANSVVEKSLKNW